MIEAMILAAAVLKKMIMSILVVGAKILDSLRGVAVGHATTSVSK